MRFCGPLAFLGFVFCSVSVANAQKINSEVLDDVAEQLSIINHDDIADCVSVSHWALKKNYTDADAINNDAVMFALQAAWYRAYLLNTGREIQLLDVVSLSNLQNLSKEDVSYKVKWSEALEFCTNGFVGAYNSLSLNVSNHEEVK